MRCGWRPSWSRPVRTSSASSKGVYESVEFAKLKLLARALERAEVYDGGRLIISYLLRDDFLEVGAVEPYSEGIIDYLRAVEGSDMAVLIREPPTRGGPKHRVSLRSRSDELDVSEHRAEGGRRRASPGGRLLERARARRSHRLHPRGVRGRGEGRSVGGAERCRPEGFVRAGLSSSTSRPGPSSFRVVRAIRSRTGARTGHAGTLDPFASGLLLVLSGAATRLAPWLVGLDKRYLTEIDLRRRTSTGIPEGETIAEGERSCRRTSCTRGSIALRGERGAADPRRLGRKGRG